MSNPSLTIVVPTYRLHFDVATALVESIDANVRDPECLILRFVVERENMEFVNGLAKRFGSLRIEATDTESIMSDFGIEESAQAFLTRAGKFSFQALKKIGGFLASTTDWVLCMDSESLFLKAFSATELLEDYRARKYIFYSKVSQRGPGWAGSLSDTMTRNAARLVGGKPDRWFMEYYHWFYERRVWSDLIKTMRRNGGLRRWLDNQLPIGIFENVLYYQFVTNEPSYGYQPVDVVTELDALLPKSISARVRPALLGRLTVVGLVEYILSLVSLDEIAELKPFFTRFSLPFLRLELNVLESGFVAAIEALPSVVALVSSHRLEIAAKRVAVCISGEFRSVHANIRAIRGFVTGVACDIYVHCWNDDAVPIIKDGLDPFAILAEERPDVTVFAEAIAKPEPLLKPGRDAGSLYMFHGIQRSLEMMAANVERYNFVVRMRPDMLFEQSLQDLLMAISYDEIGGEDIVYLPNSFHSQGMNDQFAIGRPGVMRRYGQVLDHAIRNLQNVYFNPEHVFAGHLLEQGLCIKTLPMHYVLLRNEPANLDWVGHLQQIQKETWWSAFLPGPWRLRTATGLFRAKHEAMELMYRQSRWENWDMLVEASAFTRDAQHLFAKPLVRIRVEHDYKNPDLSLRVEIAGGGATGDRFVEVTNAGLRLVSDRPEGILLIAPGEHGEELRLTRFTADLDTPAADLRIAAHDPAAFPAAAYAQDDDHRVLEVPTAGSAPEIALLDRFLLRPEANRSVSAWRRWRARLLLGRARAQRRRGKLSSARRLYARVLRLDPFLAREWVQYGHALKDSGDWRGALSAYGMAKALRPGDMDAVRNHENARSHLR